MPHKRDQPWRRPKAWTYAGERLRTFLRPPVTVREAPHDLVKDHNAGVRMRDGVTLRVNIYRPLGKGPFPVILSAHPYRKDDLPKRKPNGWGLSFQFHIMNQPEPLEISSETGWEAPDPVWWTKHGYVVINADLRGAGNSEGVGTLFSSQEAEDIYDLIEWAGAQTWSTGSVGMLGVSYLAMSQYQVAALNPPSLKAICPWEGFTDAYKDFMMPGGIREKGFVPVWTSISNRIARLTVNMRKERIKHPLRDDWWEALSPDLSKIKVPILVCTSFSDANLHSNGSFRLFEKAGSVDKFAYTHRGPKWHIFYSDEACRTQLAFFDRYLRGYDVPKLPRVRLEVRESRKVITEVRSENEWPLARTVWQDLFLGKNATLCTTPGEAGAVTFDLRRNAAAFTYVFLSDTELTGPMSLRLWVSLQQGFDANLFVGVEKWRGTEYVPFEGSYGYGRDRVAIGMQKLSLRELDTSASTPHRPVHTFRTKKPVEPREIISVDIALSASSTLFRAGESLRLVVAGRYLEPQNPITGHFPARYVPSSHGKCAIHWSAKRPSALQIPTISGNKTVH